MGTEVIGDSGRRRVFLVHGRDLQARDAMTKLLRAFDVRVVTWRDASTRAGGGTPSTLDIVRAGMDMASAIVVLLTPDDIGMARPKFRQDRDGRHETEPTGQARLNVVFEAGMATAMDARRLVVVEAGPVRPLSDIAGLNVIRITDDVETRRDFAARLRGAGLEVDTENDDWRTAGSFYRSEEDQGNITDWVDSWSQELKSGEVEQVLQAARTSADSLIAEAKEEAKTLFEKRRQEADAYYEEARARAARAAADFEVALNDRRDRFSKELAAQTAALSDAQERAALMEKEAEAAAARRDSIRAQLVKVRQVLAEVAEPLVQTSGEPAGSPPDKRDA